MLVMLTGDAAEGIYWEDASSFNICMKDVWISINNNVVSRPILDITHPEDVIEFQEKFVVKIEQSGVVRKLVDTGDVISYVCSFE